MFWYFLCGYLFLGGVFRVYTHQFGRYSKVYTTFCVLFWPIYICLRVSDYYQRKSLK